MRILLLLLSSALLQVRACDWDLDLDPDQELVSGAALQTDRMVEVSGPEACRSACCSDPDCDLALLGFPADGGLQCMLVRCRDKCVFQPSSQFRVYRKKGHNLPGDQAPEAGERRHVVPLMEDGEPRSNESNRLHCLLPPQVGSCRASLPRFFYNSSSQTCSHFLFGGCQSNGNNFLTKGGCEESCGGVTGAVLPVDSTPAPDLPAKAPRMGLHSDVSVVRSEDSQLPPPQDQEMSAELFAERCGAQPEVGPCRAAFQHWFYSRETGGCQTFIYGGCQGNQNNYETKQRCMDTCTGETHLSVLLQSECCPPQRKPPPPAANGKAFTEYEEACMATPDIGPCRAAFPMFYYDRNTASCQPFLYGGCLGNQNRYSTMEGCKIRCQTNDGSFETRGKARERWTAAVFLFVTLAVVSALLLTTLVIITLRRHRLSRHLSSVSDKEELLPDEQSSVVSLNVSESPKPDQA
ncbi:kunitz-type protease inhibitor 2 [Eleginops maclovinus]|uniref:kunitz-type protease inhibitor 2 n=1 Tax=Eleginops maclovinus TaxID=56733 RepID=UPI00307FD25A